MSVSCKCSTIISNQQINFNKFKYYMRILKNVFFFYFLFICYYFFWQFTAFQYNTVVQPGSQVCFFSQIFIQQGWSIGLTN